MGAKGSFWKSGTEGRGHLCDPESISEKVKKRERLLSLLSGSKPFHLAAILDPSEGIPVEYIVSPLGETCGKGRRVMEAAGSREM